MSGAAAFPAAAHAIRRRSWCRLAARLIAFSSLCLTAHALAQTGAVEGTVRLEPMKQPPAGAYRTRTVAPIQDPEPARAIVYLERDGPNASGPMADAIVTVDQRGYQFRPAIVAVPVGSQVAFPNLDDEFHSVFSYSSSKRFDLGRYRKDEESPLVTFDEPGVVRVYCEIHKHMRGLVLVLDTPWFTTTDEEGRYSLADVPAGRYRLRAFLPSENTLEAEVTVAPGAPARVDLGAER